MQNLCYSRPDPVEDKFSSYFGMFVQNVRNDGSVSLDPVKDPYEGLLSTSFSLAAQVQAGVPLQHVGLVPGTSISSIDVNNRSASEFMNQVISDQKSK